MFRLSELNSRCIVTLPHAILCLLMPGWCLQMTGAAHSRYRSGSPAGVWTRAAPAPAAGMTCLAALRSATTTTAASFPMAVSIAVSLEALLSISQSCACAGADYDQASFEVRMGREDGCTMVGECTPPALARSALTLCARPHQAAASSPRHTRCLGTMWV